MSKIKELLKLAENLNIDDLSFYEMNGKLVVRKAGGFKGKELKTDPKFAKARQNSSEFGHCARVGRVLRLALGGATKKLGEPYLHNKIVSLLRNVVKLDTISERGNRNIAIALQNAEAKKMFQGFELSSTHKCTDYLQAKYNLLPESPVKLDIQTQAESFNFPKDAALMRIKYYWVALNPETLECKTTMSGAVTITANNINESNHSVSFINSEVEQGKRYFLFEEIWHEQNNGAKMVAMPERAMRIVGVV